MADLTRLGRYQLKRVLGRGAMGVVYEGLDPALNRRVAVKTILRNAAIVEETARAYSAQFAREAQAAGRLNHPNIVQVHDFAEEGDVAFLVMEYIEGSRTAATQPSSSSTWSSSRKAPTPSLPGTRLPGCASPRRKRAGRPRRRRGATRMRRPARLRRSHASRSRRNWRGVTDRSLTRTPP